MNDADRTEIPCIRQAWIASMERSITVSRQVPSSQLRTALIAVGEQILASAATYPHDEFEQIYVYGGGFMMTLPDPSTPIDEALIALALPDAVWPGVRTFGDLLVVVERGEVDDPAVLRALGVAPKKGKKADAVPRDE